jgi:DNA-binding SARP family transcriptional activator
VRIRTLGPLEVVDDAGRRVALPAAKERTLLWLLLIAPGRLTTNDHLIDALWEGQPPPTAITTLRSLVSRLRKALGDPGRIEARPSGYVLVVDAEDVDSSRFETLLDAARDCVRYDTSTAIAAYREALELWTGAAFAEVAHTEWAQGVAAHLETDRLVATEELFEAELSGGRHREVAAELETACRDHPLRERFWGQLMSALYRLRAWTHNRGERGGALRGRRRRIPSPGAIGLTRRRMRRRRWRARPGETQVGVSPGAPSSRESTSSIAADPTRMAASGWSARATRSAISFIVASTT